MSFGALLLALAQITVFGAIGWVIANRALDRVRPDPTDEGFGAPERMLFAIVGGVAFAVALMVAHIVTGGAVFGLPGLVPAAALGLVAFGRRTFRRPANIPWVRLLLLAAALLVLYLAPVLTGGSGIRTGDSPWHLGWSQQLLAGEPVPTGPAPEYGRNAYPWGWHAVIATLVRLVPGSHPVIAYEALHLIVLAGVPLAAAAIARRLDPAAGWAGAIAATLVGGFGWFEALGRAFVTTPERAAFGADLVVASPNSVYALFSPALPRELGVVLLGACAVLLASGAGGGRRMAVAAGVVAGILGVVSVPLFVSAMVWFALVGLYARRARGLRLRWLFVPALAIFGVWAGPVVGNYLRFGGFVDITPSLGREWPLPVAFASWGLLLPAAIAGVVLCVRRQAARPLVFCLAGSCALLLAAVARGAFDWALAGNATLLHQGRVWPVVHLLGAAFGGAAVAALFRWSRPYRVIVAGVLVPVLLASAVASPALASLRVADLISLRKDGFVYGGRDYAPDSFVARAADVMGPDDVVRVVGSDRLAWALFQYTGVRLADYEDPRLDGNELRIRYRDLAEAWDAQMRSGGFETDYRVVIGPILSGPHPVVLTGEFHGTTWSIYEL